MSSAGQMRLTVLGKSPAWHDAAGACSGYLIEAADFALLLDCGHGVPATLRRVRERVDAVVLSHMHPDHFFGLIPWAYALTVAPRAGLRGRPRLLLPPGGRELLTSLDDLLSLDDHLEEAFAVEGYQPDSPLEAGPLTLSFRPVPHFVPTWAIAVEHQGRRLVYGADCGPGDGLVAFTAGADLALYESTLPVPDPQGSPFHLSAREAGEHARAAGAARLVLTHFSDELDSLSTRRDGEAGFGRPVELARCGAVYVV